MMFKTLLSLFLSFAFHTLSAQQADFVEILVEDTVRLAADDITYKVSATDDLEADAIPRLKKTTGPTAPSPLTEVRRLIKELGLDTLQSDTYLVSNNSYERISASLQIRFRSYTDLKRFANRISSIKHIVAAVVSVKSFREAEGTDTLFARLTSKAQLQAATIAQAVGKKLSRLVSVQEQPVQGGWTMYPPLSAIPGWHTTVSISDAYVTLQRKLAVRFAWQ